MRHIHKTILKSGIKVIAEEMPEAASASIGIWVKNGSRLESPAEAGISHFIEHLFFKGTKKRTSLDIAKAIESVGGVLNAFTGKEYTCFYAKVLNKDLPLAIDILSDIFINSTFLSKELEKERMVVLQEIKMVEDTPDDLIHDLFSEKLWSGHPLGSPILGTAKTVSSFKREDVVKYFKRRYYNQSVFITLAGGIKTKNVVKLLEGVFGRFERSGEELPSTRPKPSVGVELVRRDLEQVHLCLGVPAPSQTDRDRYKLYILNTILGGGMSSRLFQEIREKRGLAYSVYSYLNLVKDAGSLTVYAGTSNKDFGRVITIILEEFRKLRKGALRDELKVAKEQLKGGILLGLETSDSRMSKLARDEIYFNRNISVEEMFKEIDGVTSRDVKELSERLLRRENIAMVAIGRVSKKDLPTAVKTLQ